MVRVYRSNLSDPSNWTQVYTPPPSTDGRLHDEWGVALGVKHDPSESYADVGVMWHDTRLDISSTTRNEYVDIFASTNQNSGNTGSGYGWQGPWQVNSSAVWSPADAWGKYEGMAPDISTLNGAFFMGWGDNRDWSTTVKTQAWVAGVVHN